MQSDARRAEKGIEYARKIEDMKGYPIVAWGL